MLIKNYLPWWSKILAKIVLSRLPINYEFWKKISLFENGLMHQPEYAYEIFKRHFESVNLEKGFVSLELGPGDSLFSSLNSVAFGGTKCYLVDANKYASNDIHIYTRMAEYLSNKNLYIPDIKSCRSREEVLSKCNAKYLTNGLSSLREIPDKSVDFIFSYNVLEHLRKSDFLDMMKEIRRIITDDGFCSHTVDLKDHLSFGLNHLRFSEPFWESNFMSSSGFYTNRIQYSQMLKIFKAAKFHVDVKEVKRWPNLPTPKNKFANEFQDLSDEELRISDFSVVLTPK
jgi:SAM-dependent methyltransferase